MAKIIIDAANTPLGRVGTMAAKESLRGNEVIVINVEKSIISGDKLSVLAEIMRDRKRGGTSQKGPQFPRLPERFFKRKIRGMFPREQRGKDLWKALRCYEGNGKLHEDEIKHARKIEGKLPLKYSTIKELCRLLH